MGSGYGAFGQRGGRWERSERKGSSKYFMTLVLVLPEDVLYILAAYFVEQHCKLVGTTRQ